MLLRFTAILVAILASLSYVYRPWRHASSIFAVSMTNAAVNGTSSSTSPTPVWALAHGGPNSLYDSDHAAHIFWKSTFVNDIRRAQPKGIVIVSAHWQAERPPALHGVSGRRGFVEVNTDESNPLIFDFYGFPSHYYNAKFPSHNPAWLHSKVSAHLQQHGYGVHETQRGIDHGVWVPLKAAFGEKLDIPLVQVSLPIESGNAEQDIVAALKLGRTLRALRSEGVLIIGSGQPVHNLRDLRTYGFDAPARPYAKTFGSALNKAMSEGVHDSSKSNGVVENDDADSARWSTAKDLATREDFKPAHPTYEHLLPFLVSLGAAFDNEKGVQMFDYKQASLVWDMYRFGAPSS